MKNLISCFISYFLMERFNSFLHYNFQFQSIFEGISNLSNLFHFSESNNEYLARNNNK